MKTSPLLGLTLLALLASGCNTTAGAGKDLQSAGKAITKSAQDKHK